MATPVISRPTAVDSLPLLTIGDENPDKGGRLGQATKSSKALIQATADQQDTSNGDDQALECEKEVEMQADTKDEPLPLPLLLPRPQPQPQPRLLSPVAVAAPDADPNGNEPLVPAGPRPATSTEHGTVNPKTRDTDAEKQQKGPSAVASSKSDAISETAAVDVVVRKPRLPYRRNNKGLRKGGKQKEKGALGRAYDKLKMGIFSKKKKEPVDENPYANPITPYQQARNDLAQGAKAGGPGGLPSNPRMNSYGSSPAPPPYQSPAGAGGNNRFGDEKYGNQNGYGSNRYDNDNASSISSNSRRPGGYGGFGDEGGNNDLFGGAAGRYVPPQPGANASPANGAAFQPAPSRYDNDPSKNALLGNAQNRYDPMPPASRQEGQADDEYGGYGAPRELTEEEREREEVRATQAETRAVRKAGVDSLARSRALANQALASAASSAARLGEQDARLQRTERNMDAALVMSRESEKSTKELNRINNSMFSVWTGPGKRELKKRDAETMEQYQADRAERERTAKAGYQSEQHMEDMFKDMSGNKPRGPLGKKSSAAERSKYVFNDDSDEEQARQDQDDEDQIEEGIDDLTDLVGKLKSSAIGMGGTLTTQNERLDRLAGKTELVDDRVRMNREKLSRIR